jgi:tyrosyl-tRNA synthetase
MGHGAQHLDGGLDAFIGNPTKGERDKMEAANLNLYETPIAKQLGEPVRKSYTDVSRVQRMKNSTHYRTVNNRPWWHYIAPWNWGKSRVFTKDHNVK